MKHPMAVNVSARGKLLIPGLLLVLLVVLVWPNRPSRESRAVSATQTEVKSSSEAPPHLVSIPLDRSNDRRNAVEPPRYTLSDAIAINPFDMPIPSRPVSVEVALPVAAVEPTLDDSAKLSSQADSQVAPTASMQLQAIYFDERGAAAIIEDRVFRIGDQLTDGRTVARITKQGVELTP